MVPGHCFSNTQKALWVIVSLKTKRKSWKFYEIHLPAIIISLLFLQFPKWSLALVNKTASTSLTSCFHDATITTSAQMKWLPSTSAPWVNSSTSTHCFAKLSNLPLVNVSIMFYYCLSPSWAKYHHNHKTTNFQNLMNGFPLYWSKFNINSTYSTYRSLLLLQSCNINTYIGRHLISLVLNWTDLLLDIYIDYLFGFQVLKFLIFRFLFGTIRQRPYSPSIRLRQVLWMSKWIQRREVMSKRTNSRQLPQRLVVPSIFQDMCQHHHHRVPQSWWVLICF